MKQSFLLFEEESSKQIEVSTEEIVNNFLEELINNFVEEIEVSTEEINYFIKKVEDSTEEIVQVSVEDIFN